ncbi:hypothetical protein GCM10025862_07260 [Arsenicicoccus piscis]|uniref:Benzoate transporter n=1 Tax=Arsenicicoccus piscis TaxID=673954 RepID=A0ABQ6HM68_9MICO|nr:hypothetical protein GCM10025862_07260 [Arsenicicoccus piscis]
MVVTGTFSHVPAGSARPVVDLVAPTFSLPAIVALGLPLFLVTMTSQNIPGMAVLGSFGYRPDFRGPLTYAGAATSLGALAGGHAINLAAISAALAAGPEAHPDPRKRWVAGVSWGLTYLAFGPLAGLVAAVAEATPDGIVETVAGLALIGTFAGAASAALGSAAHRDAAAITVLVSASGLAVGGIGAAFWGLVAGGLYLIATSGRGRPPHATDRPPASLALPRRQGRPSRGGCGDLAHATGGRPCSSRSPSTTSSAAPSWSTASASG